MIERIDALLTAYEHGVVSRRQLLQSLAVGLADVYAVLNYYLQHRSDIDLYLQQREELAQRVRTEVEARNPQDGLVASRQSDPVLYLHRIFSALAGSKRT